MSEDSRLAALRYCQEREAREQGDASAGAQEQQRRAPANGHERAIYVESLIDQAIRAGEFDDLPGAGKPLEGLGGRHDPDWWIRRKIEREQLGGLGPPALTLRTENAELDGRLDALHREHDVRETLTDFNRRVIDARRQLQGGPPVVTPTRDVEAEVAAWRARRIERIRVAAERREAEEAAAGRLGWRERWRARRRRGGSPSLDG